MALDSPIVLDSPSEETETDYQQKGTLFGTLSCEDLV
jgi:hypothetical protein